MQFDDLTREGLYLMILIGNRGRILIVIWFSVGGVLDSVETQFKDIN